MSGLLPRPGATPEEIAVVTAAYLGLQRSYVDEPVADPTPRWRFSHRWFQPGR